MDAATTIEEILVRRATNSDSTQHEKQKAIAAARRKVAIWRGYKEDGLTLREVGALHGISGERARQIVAEVQRRVSKARVRVV